MLRLCKTYPGSLKILFYLAMTKHNCIIEKEVLKKSSDLKRR